MLHYREYEPFVHRPIPDGTTDTICKSCFATVCNSIRETELARAEKSHVCDPSAIARFKRMLNPETKNQTETPRPKPRLRSKPPLS
jgi:hypothetical protein